MIADSTLRRLWPRWPGWQHLPREARDTLFQLAVIGWTVLPHLLRLPLWCTAMVTFTLGWRAVLAVSNSPLPSRWTVIAVLALALALTGWTEGTLLGKEAGVTMLVILMSLKMLELRARRDALVVFFLGFFLVLTHFLYSQSLLMMLVTLGSVWGLLTALVLSHMPVGRPPLTLAGGVALRAALWALPLVVVLFVLFPRMAPLWGVPQDAGGRTGLSGSLRMGGVASLVADESIVMRVRFLAGKSIPPEALYFRGPVLGSFDGREWNRLPNAAARMGQPKAELRLLGEPVDYELTLEPSRTDLLPLLEITPELTAPELWLEGLSARLRSDMQWQLNAPVTDRLRVQARAWPNYRYGPSSFGHELDAWLQLPRGVNPRTLAWATQFRAENPRLENGDANALAGALMNHIRISGFSYTFEPGAYGANAIDEFWLDRKLGFCEHYASAFVAILRSWGVPARIVTGFQGADPEPVDGWWVVRNSNAHAWAEYWQPGQGWVRADPTAAVAPDRVRRGQALQRPRGFVAQAIDRVHPRLLDQMRATLERFDNRWNQWVLNYSRGTQFGLLREIGFDMPSWSDLSYVLIGVLSLGAATAAGWALWDRQRQDPWQRLQAKIRWQLGQLGVQVGHADPPRTRAARVRETLGADGETLACALDALDRARYAPGAARGVDAAWWRNFRKAAATIRGKASPGASAVNPLRSPAS